MNNPLSDNEPKKLNDNSILNFAWELKKNGRAEATIKTTIKRRVPYCFLFLITLDLRLDKG